jgi:site-specific DNA recombinase
MRAAIYTRLSRDREEQTSTARQERDARALCAARDWEVAGVFEDVDFSAFSGRQRPEYERLLAAIEAGEVDVVVVWKIDRLARRLATFVRFAEACDERGVALVSVSEPFDTSSPFGKAILQMLAVFAELESENIRVRVRSARDGEVRAGRAHSGGKRRFGYTRAMEILPEEAEAVRAAAPRLLAGASLSGLAAEWNASGVLTTEGNEWSVGNLARTLKSPHLAGLRVHKRRGQEPTVQPGNWEPVLSREDHAELTAHLSRRRRGGSAHSYLLSGGLLQCGREGCGAALVAHPQGPGRRAYWCPKAPGYRGCGRLSVVAGPVEEEVAAQVLHALAGPQTLWAVDEARSTGRAREVLDELEALAARREELAASFAAGRLPLADYEAASRRLAEDEAAGQARLGRLRHGDAMAGVPAGGELGALLAWWEEAPLARRRDLLGAVLEAVVVRPAGAVRHRFDPERVELRWRA